jgi:hypothetical protein
MNRGSFLFYYIILFHCTSTTPYLSSPCCKPLRHYRTAAALRPSTLAAHPCPPPEATVAGPVATSRERRCIDPFFRAARRRSELTSWPQVRSTLPPSTDLPTSASSPLAASSRRRSLQGWSISGFLITNLMVDFSIFSLSSSGALKKENIQYLLN